MLRDELVALMTLKYVPTVEELETIADRIISLLDKKVQEAGWWSL
jgi:hypothetical protein